MAGIVKKGYLDVKKKGMLGSTYKKQYVVLRRNVGEGTKVVEIMSNEQSDNSEDIEFLPLTGTWNVQDKSSQNKKRYAFELFIGAHVVMTFSCPSSIEREEWMESFNVLNKISSYTTALNAPDMYLVSLETSASSAEIGVSGPCLLRIQDGAIVLYSECGRNRLHHWAAENIKNLSISGEQLFLEAYKTGNDSLMEFCFNTENDTARHILTSWNLALMESIDPQKLSLISSYILSQGNGGGGGGSLRERDDRAQKSASLSKNLFGSLRQGKVYGTKEDKGVVRRAKSFSDKTTNEVRLSPDPKMKVAESRLSVTSQESYTINAINPGSDEEFRNSPPPIPPRAPRRPRSMGLETVDAHPDPDYSYIKDDVPYDGGQNSGSTPSVDKQLDDLLRDIEEDNFRKKRRKTLEPSLMRRHNNFFDSSSHKAKTLSGGARYSDDFDKKKQEFIDIYGENRQASDYLEPVPSKRVTEYMKRASNPPLLNGSIINEDDHQTKRHSASGDFVSITSKHDYSTIPDRPLHFHSASTDSTHSAPDVPPRMRRSQNALQDPPSPLSHHPARTGLQPGASLGKTDDISPYATATMVGIAQLDSHVGSRGHSPPPLPPRSPSKAHRGSLPPTSQRSYNGTKTRLSKAQSLGGSEISSRNSFTDFCKHHSPLEGTPLLSQTSISSQSSSSGVSELTNSLVSKRYSDFTSTSSPPQEDLENALQMLDDCVKGLEVFETSPTLPDSPTKAIKPTSDATNSFIDSALQQTFQIQNDLTLAKKENTLPSGNLQRSLSNSASKFSPSDFGRRTLPPHRSTSSIDPTLSVPVTISPAILPRSHASLHTTSMTQLDSKVTMRQSTTSPKHKYFLHNSTNFEGPSNTVFIHHIKDNIRASHV